MEGGRETGRGQSGCLSPLGPPAPRSFGPGPWPPLSSLQSSFLLPPLFPLPSLLLPSSSSSLLPPSPRGTPPPASSFPHRSTCQDEHAQGTTGVVVLRTWCYRGNIGALGLKGLQIRWRRACQTER